MRLGGRGVMVKKVFKYVLVSFFSVKTLKNNTLEASHIVSDWS